ncbi:MAG: tetratricopeptide repeat protein [Oligoflexus sp.]
MATFQQFSVLSWSILLTLFLSMGSDANAQSSGERMPPLIEFSISNEIPFLVEYGFVLKHRAKHFPISSEDAFKSYDQVMEVGKKLADRADKAQLKELYETYFQLYDVYQFLGKLDWQPQVETRIQEMRQLIYRMGEWIYLKESRDDKRRSVRFSYLALGLGDPSFQQDAIRELLGMKNKAPAQYRPAIHLLSYYYLSSTESTLTAARKYLQKHQKELTRYERKVISVIQARIDAGLVGDKKVAEAKPDIAKSLLSLSEQVKKSRYEGVRNRIDGTILHTWMAINPQADWRRIPLSDVANRSRSMPAGLMERMILEEVKEGQFLRGSQVYNKLSQDFAASPVVAKIDLRRLKLIKLHVAQSQQYELALRSYQELLQKYSQELPGHESRFLRQVHVSIARDFEAYSLEVIKAAQQAEFPADNRLAVAAIGQGFVQRFANQRLAVKAVKEELAKLLELAGKAKEAVQLFLDLAKDDAEKYLPLAIQAQMKAARWPSDIPWVEPQADSRMERAALAKMIEDYRQVLVQKNQALDWYHLAHLGLIYRQLGTAEKAETLWRDHVQYAKAGDASQGAFGLLLMTYFKAENWNELIQVFQVAEQKGVTPSFENRLLNSEAMYQLALLKRAQTYQAGKQWAEALADYTAFVNRFKEDRRRILAIYQTVHLHRQLDQLNLAVDQIKLMIQDYPQQALSKRAILEGAQWTQAAGREHLQQAAFLFQTFMDMFANDPLMPKARLQLAYVQQSLQDYQNASQNFRNHALDGKVAKAERVRAALHHIRLAAVDGDLRQATTIMEPVLKLSDRGQKSDFISAHVILARLATEKQQEQQMSQLEELLLPYIKERKDVAEAIGMLRLSRLEAKEYEIPFSQNLETVESYRSAIDTVYQRFLEISKAYDQVCKDGDNSLCYQAYVRTRQYAQEALDATGSMMVGKQIEAEQLEELRRLQNAHLDKLKEFHDYYNRMADKYENFQAPNIPAGIIAAH